MMGVWIYRMAFWVCGVLVFLLVPWEAFPEEITLLPQVEVSGGYDDNINYSKAGQKAGYVGSGKPGFMFSYGDELFTINSGGSVEFLRYFHDSNLNRENYRAFFDGSVKLTERLNLRGNFSFVNDTTLDSQLEETGIVSFRTGRKNYTGGGELAYQITMLSNIGIAFNHQSTRYGSILNEDFDNDSIRAFYDHTFNDGLDHFTVTPYYDYWNSDVSTVNNYGLSLGLSHSFSETFSIAANIGPRYTQTERKYSVPQFVFDPETGTIRLVLKEMKAIDGNFGGTGSIEVKKEWLRSSVNGGYSHYLTYSSSTGRDAEPINVDRFFCALSHRITSRLRAAVSGSFYISESASSFGDQDRRYMTVSPSLNYEFNGNYALSLTYSHNRQLNKRVDSDPGSDRNRVWIQFTGRWPMKW
jgi:hypothetical protein